MGTSSDEEDGPDFRSRAMEIYRMAGSKAETAAAASSVKKTIKGDSKAQDRDEFRRMAMALYKQEPGTDGVKVMKMRQKMASKVRKVQAEARKQDKAVRVKEIVVSSNRGPKAAPPTDSDDYSSSDEDNATKARRAKDREIQAAKAKKMRKTTTKDVADGAKAAAKGFLAGAASLIKKIKNEDEDEEKLDGNDENKDFVERRRKLRAMLGDDNFALRTDEAADMGKDTVKHAQWEIDFIMMQRRKRTIAIVLVSLLICCIIGIPPVWVHMLDQDCADPSETRPDVFSFAAAEVEEIHITSYRGTVIVKAANSSTSSGQINVEVQSKAVSESALEAIKVTATEELLNNGRSVIHVMARFDEVAADSTFSLWNCPMSDITVTVPPVTYADAQPFGPSLNITMDGPEGSPILYPWIPNLIAVVGTVTLDMQPSMAVGGLAVTNKIDNVVVSGYAGKSLSVFTTVGDIYVSDAKLPAAQLVSSSGNVHIANVDLVDLETITQEDTTPHLFQSADLSAMASLGYSNIAPSLAGELTYGHQRYVYADSSSGDVIVSHIAHGNIRAHSGSGKLAVTLSTLGFSGYYELHAPFAPEDRGFWDGVVQEQRLQSLYSIRDNDMGEVDALYVNTTLLLEKLGASDTSEALDPLARVGRIFMHDGNVGGQRLLAESDCGDVSVLVKEELHNYTSLLNFLKEK